MKECNLYAVSQTAGSDQRSSIFDLGDLSTFSIAVDFSGGAGDLVGTLYLECSNDGTDFVVVANSSQAITVSASHMWSVTWAGYRYIRVYWDYTSGTGAIAAKLVAKENVVKGV